MTSAPWLRFAAVGGSEGRWWRELDAGFGALSALLLVACNGQFAFDRNPLDAGDASPELDALSETGGQGGGGGDDAPPPDTSITDASPPSIQINCGQTVCTSPSCCSTDAGQMCITTPADGTCSGLSIQCDDTSDCPADKVCCAETGNNIIQRSGSLKTPDNAERLVRIHCETEAHCRSLNYVILCDPDKPAPCAQCVLSSLDLLPPGYHQCSDTP